MVTKMQRAFAASKLLQRAIDEIFAAEGAPHGRGYKRFYSSLNKDVFVKWPEPQITLFLLQALYCDDIKQAEIAEALHILRQAETALTAEQSRQLQEYLEILRTE